MTTDFLHPVTQPHRHCSCGMIVRSLVMACLLVCAVAPTVPAAPRCDATGKGYPAAYARALDAVWNLPEYVAMEHHGVKVAAIDATDHQVLIRGRCYWEITTYANGPQTMQRMDTFYVDSKDQVVMADDLGGQRITLAAWRRLQQQLAAPAESAKP